MANFDFPRGFEVVRKTDGADPRLQYATIAPTNTAIGKNDLLEARSDGFIWRAQAGTTTAFGIAAEAKAANTGGEIGYEPIDATTVIRAQSDDATIAAQTNLLLNYDIVDAAPSAAGLSQQEIDGSTGDTTASLPIKAIKVEQVVTPNGNVFGNHVVLECIVNQGAYKGAGTVGA